ncbi:energy-coupling factor transporter ATPase [Thomasclavelia cocleata]|uniref:Energy-coupling factor transporter ATP-binding protein EcfA2 n=1 Tax=Thomasclavelia cocleata TaxID=69824 RepID=A0A1I0C7N8_9FIRM|nr:energy-coupling factor transporter ATPase [Thomasclavelia cocleata]MCR1959640.1 energy-coupling factor transporter ATPase [Thomasclavelia cocleata]NDO42263.1 energy-coupling factor transporter ATPase [Thomasclavelia cocleata]PJN80118.1 energy-coupling factor transporter ATPase [Thomasclavelia cocleata]SET15559.1 energy-coupling factor transport system ATP-binding protein [Thomasclavelia cocleata]
MPITFKEIEHIYSENTPFSYQALKGVNLNIKDKSFTAIIGQTGSGKSTLIQHINALLLPTSGEINVDEFIITATDKPSKLKPLRKKAGLVFQFPEYQLFEETIEKDIIFGPMNFGVSEEEAKKIASKVLKMVGLNESYLSKSPFELSGGQKRRVAIAGILAMNPDILILDEPTAGLDPQGTNEMMSLFKKINDLGKTIILITHDMNHVLQYCDEVVVMNHGRVEKHDSVTNIFKDSNYLNSLGIDLPIITDFILKLNNHGFNIDSSINNIDQLVLAIGGEING